MDDRTHEELRATIVALKSKMIDYDWHVGAARYWQEAFEAFEEAFRGWPDMPSPSVLARMGEFRTMFKFPDDYERGKEAQSVLGLDAIPPVSECEAAAGFWLRVTRSPLPTRPGSSPAADGGDAT